MYDKPDNESGDDDKGVSKNLSDEDAAKAFDKAKGENNNDDESKKAALQNGTGDDNNEDKKKEDKGDDPWSIINEMSKDMTAMQEELAQLRSDDKSSASKGDDDQDKKKGISIDLMKGVELSDDVDPYIRKDLEGALPTIADNVREHVVDFIKDVTPKIISGQFAVQNEYNNFWSRNDDLKPDAEFVEWMANKVRAENPKWTLTKILEEAETRVRAARGLTRKADNQDGKDPKDPKPDGSRATKRKDKDLPKTPASRLAKSVLAQGHKRKG